MDPIIGIDLGTTNSLAGCIDTGFTVILPDKEGHRLTPSCVSFSNAQEEPLIGHTARHARQANPRNTVYSIKRFMGQPFQAVNGNDLSYPIKQNSDGGVCVPLHGKNYTPSEISALILKRLKTVAEGYLGQGVKRAVITVPAYFNDTQRSATKLAGELAGLTVERILNEPTAAAMAFGIDRKLKHCRCAVYDLGGGTFDLSILEIHDGLFQVLSTNGNTRLGGDDIDRALTEELARRLALAGHKEIGDKLFVQLHEEAEKAKCVLSEKECVEIQIPFIRPDFSFSTTVHRSELEALARPIVEQTRKHCLQALADAKLKREEINEVILVGGQTRMPLVRQLVAEIFGREPNTSVNPDEAVALGSTIQGGILSGAIKNMVLLDVTPLSLGIETFGGLMNVIIPRNSTIPTKAGEQFTNAVDGQQSMSIHVLQGERELAKDNWSLGKFELAFQPAPRGVARVGVQFEIDADGILHVLARDIQTGHQKIIEMKSVVDVSDETVEKMVEESVEHAFEDMQERQWIETEQKARRQVKATLSAVTQTQTIVEANELTQIEASIQQIEKALEEKNLSKLKESLKTLDQTTSRLAQALMDQAMEEALKRKGGL